MPKVVAVPESAEGSNTNALVRIGKTRIATTKGAQEIDALLEVTRLQCRRSPTKTLIIGKTPSGVIYLDYVDARSFRLQIRVMGVVVGTLYTVSQASPSNGEENLIEFEVSIDTRPKHALFSLAIRSFVVMILSGIGFSLAGIWSWLLLGGAVGIGFSVLSVIVQLILRNDAQVRARLVQAFVDVIGHDSIAPSKQVCHPFRCLESK